MEESVGTLANVAQCTQQLRQCSLSVEENAISGDLLSVISSLVQSLHYCSSPDQTAHTLGALASTLTVYDIEAESTKASDHPIVIEQTLANQLKPPLSFLVQERTIQALARLYGNSFLSNKLAHSEAKMMLLWLITMETNRVRDAFVRALLALCSSEGNLWCALQGREGVQLLISLRRPSYGPHQEYIVGLLSLLSNENDESNSAITAAGGILALVDLLKLIPDHHVTPFLALGLLTQLAKDCPDNMIVMAKCGALEALIKYLSLGPQDAAEEAATDLLGLLFSSNVITRHESALGAVSQLIVVLQRGGRRARCSAANALKLLFLEPSIRNKPEIRQGVQPLWEILNTGSEEEQHAAIAALASSVDKVWSRPYVEKVRKESVDVLCRVLSSNCSMEVKRDAAEICCTLFRNTKMKSTASAACCVDPLVSLLVSEFGPCHLPAINALDELVEDNEKLAEIVVAGGVVVSLTGLLLEGKDYVLHATICGLLEKLGKHVPACREEMAKAGVIERLDEICKRWPFYLVGEDKCSKLMSLLTNNKRGLKRKKIRERRKLYQPPTKKKGIARKC